MEIEIKYYKGDVDCFGNHITEDRYIIVDSNNIDIYGEHFDLKTAKELTAKN